MNNNEFNFNDYLEDLKECIRIDIKNNNIDESYEGILQYIEDYIDGECIYTYRCYEILMDLGITDFSNAIDEFNATELSSIAYYYLRDYTFDEINIDEILNEFVNNKDVEEEEE